MGTAEQRMLFQPLRLLFQARRVGGHSLLLPLKSKLCPEREGRAQKMERRFAGTTDRRAKSRQPSPFSRLWVGFVDALFCGLLLRFGRKLLLHIEGDGVGAHFVDRRCTPQDDRMVNSTTALPSLPSSTQRRYAVKIPASLHRITLSVSATLTCSANFAVPHFQANCTPTLNWLTSTSSTFTCRKQY
jgi:hypothetical protein